MRRLARSALAAFAVLGAQVPGAVALAQPSRPVTPVTKDGAVPNGAGAARPARLRILATNDVHGALEPRPDNQGVLRGGIGPLAAAIERARGECTRRPGAGSDDCASILLDGGDEFQGTPASNFAFGRPIVEAFRRLELSASALGNHEFDWTIDTLRARIRQAPYAILGANVHDRSGGAVPWLRADTLIRRAGLRIGVIGLATTETPTTTRSANVRTLRFDALAPAVDARARRLRARGADVVIVIAHSGAFCDARPGDVLPDTAAPGGCHGEIIDLARAVTEKVDAIVSGHTHSVVNTIVHGIPIVQARSSGRALGVIDLDLEGGTAPHIEVREVVADSTVRVPVAIDSVIRRALAAVGPRVNRPIAEIAEDMPIERDEQYALGNLIADAQRWAGHGDVAFMNNGGIRANLRRGLATYGSLFEIQPFGNTLTRMTVRGRDLRAYLEKLVATNPRIRIHTSGVVATFDPKRPLGSRITRLVDAAGRPIDDARPYTIILSDFLAAGGDGVDLGRRAISVTPLNVVDLDALVGYLGTLPKPVKAPAEERFIAAEGTP